MHYFAGHKAPSIQRLLEAEGVSVSRVAIWKFLAKYKKAGTIARQEGSGRKSFLTRQIWAIMEEQMLNVSSYTVKVQGVLLDIDGHMSIKGFFKVKKFILNSMYLPSAIYLSYGKLQ